MCCQKYINESGIIYQPQSKRFFAIPPNLLSHFRPIDIQSTEKCTKKRYLTYPFTYSSPLMTKQIIFEIICHQNLHIADNLSCSVTTCARNP